MEIRLHCSMLSMSGSRQVATPTLQFGFTPVRCSSAGEWIILSNPPGGPIPASAPQLVSPKMLYVLSCLRNGAYTKSLFLTGKSSPMKWQLWISSLVILLYFVEGVFGYCLVLYSYDLLNCCSILQAGTWIS